ncbi:hypothetical protein [Streptomyces sp. EN16]|uniref:hypothetical protein n=1 Tax=Streptomyces sp. EN16 TaxID=212773 RepID=UPI000851EEC0|nr:hypothetical protein [Streptomyces sp. EN16]
MTQKRGGRPDPAAHKEQPEAILSEQLFAAHTKKQLHPKASRAVAAGLICVMGEILDGAYLLRLNADADEAGGKEIQPRQVDDAIRSDNALRRLLAAWLLERAPAARTEPQPVQQPVASAPDGALEGAIDRMMSEISPDESVTVSASAKSVLVGLLALLIERLMHAADVLSTRISSNVIYAEDVRAAVQVMLTGELRQLADREISRATA